MTKKRFENRLNKSDIKFNTLNPVWDNEKETALNVFEMIDLLNELTCKLKRTERGRTELAEFNVELMEKNKELKAKVDDKEVAVEVETCKVMEKIFDLIDEKIKLYSHKPFSAPISQPMSVNFDEDVDRLARLSELEALKEELTE